MAKITITDTLGTDHQIVPDLIMALNMGRMIFDPNSKVNAAGSRIGTFTDGHILMADGEYHQLTAQEASRIFKLVYG